MTRDEYFSLPALNASGAKLLLRSPAHFQADRLAKREPTPAMQMGTAVHAAILEPEKRCFIRKPAGLDRRTAAGKETYAQLMAEAAEAGELPLFDAEEADRVERIRDAVHAHTAARNLLNIMDQVETARHWRDYAADVPCKALFDAYSTKHRIILDVKTTQDASPAGFLRAVLKYQYHMQAAHYLAAARNATGKSATFIFAAVETAAPYAVALYELDADALSAGADMMERAANIYSRCMFDNAWPGYHPGITTLTLPGWAAQSSEDFA